MLGINESFLEVSCVKRLGERFRSCVKLGVMCKRKIAPTLMDSNGLISPPLELKLQRTHMD
jgi:hypothetical protein